MQGAPVNRYASRVDRKFRSDISVMHGARSENVIFRIEVIGLAGAGHCPVWLFKEFDRPKVGRGLKC